MTLLSETPQNELESASTQYLKGRTAYHAKKRKNRNGATMEEVRERDSNGFFLCHPSRSARENLKVGVYTCNDGECKVIGGLMHERR